MGKVEASLVLSALVCQAVPVFGTVTGEALCFGPYAVDWMDNPYPRCQLALIETVH